MYSSYKSPPPFIITLLRHLYTKKDVEWYWMPTQCLWGCEINGGDMACDTTLPAIYTCLLDKVFADLACKPRYTSRSAVEWASWQLQWNESGWDSCRQRQIVLLFQLLMRSFAERSINCQFIYLVVILKHALMWQALMWQPLMDDIPR